MEERKSGGAWRVGSVQRGAPGVGVDELAAVHVVELECCLECRLNPQDTRCAKIKEPRPVRKRRRRVAPWPSGPRARVRLGQQRRRRQGGGRMLGLFF